MLLLKNVDEQLLFSSKGNVAIDTFSVRGRGIVPFGIGGPWDPPIPSGEILYTCLKKSYDGFLRILKGKVCKIL